jgi:hypothetical protein
LSDSDLIIFHLLLLILTKIAKEAISVLPISIALGVAGQLLYGLAVIMLGKKGSYIAGDVQHWFQS